MMKTRAFILLFFLFAAGCTVELYPPVKKVEPLPPAQVEPVSVTPDGGIVVDDGDAIPQSYSGRKRFYWEQIEQSDSTQSFAVTNGAKDGRWLRGDSMRWHTSGPFVTVMSDTVATREYSRSLTPVTIYTGDGTLPASNRTITLNSDFDFSIVDNTFGSGFYLDKNNLIIAVYDPSETAEFQLDISDAASASDAYFRGANNAQIGVHNTNGAYISTGSLSLLSGATNTTAEIKTGSHDFVITDNSTDGDKGLEYAADYSASYKDRTLPDVAWVRGEISDSAQIIDTFSLSGTTLSLSLESDGEAAKTVDLSSLTTNETITLSGDVTGSGTTAITTTIATGAVGADELASTAVTPGSYTHASITVDADGRVTAASSGTDNTGMVTFDVIGDAGTAETISNTDELYLRGQFGVNTSNSATDIINFNIDSSEVATVNALQDTAATLRTLITGLDTLTNYTALRAYTGAGNAVYVQNQGLFIRGASGSENGGTVIVATNSVVWKRFFDGCTYYPEFWEDGGYDETGSAAGITDTTEMIQAAINLANTNGGGEVILRPGRYYSVIAKGTNVGLGGSNKYCVKLLDNIKFTIQRGATLRKADGAQTDAGGAVSVLYAECVSNVEISGGGVISGNTAGQTGWTGGYSQAGVNGAGIYFARTSGWPTTLCNYDIIVRDIIIKDHFSTPLTVSRFNGLTLSGIECHDNGEGIELTTGEDCSIENIEISDTANVAVGDGLELSAVDYFRINDIYLHSNGAGTAVDLYASHNGTLSGFVLDGYGGGGISLGTNASDRFADNIEITNGVIKNYATDGSSGVYVGDGKYKISNIVLDSVDIGINCIVPTIPAGSTNETVVSNCDFINEPNGNGIYIEGIKRMTVQNCNFRKLATGIQNSYDATGDPILKIKGNVFDSLTTANIAFDAQGQTYPTYDPVAYIEDNTFTNQLGTIGIAGIETPLNVYVKNNSSDFYPTATTTLNLQGLEEIDGSTGGSTIQTINRGAHEQILRIDCGEMPAFNARTVRDPRETPGGNIYLKDGENFKMTTGAIVTLKYDKVNNRWHEVSRAITMPFTGSGNPVGNTKMIIEGWMADDIQDSLSYTQVKRFNTSTSLGYYFIARRQFAVRKVCIYSSENITTGSVTAGLFWNGTGPNATVTLNSTNPRNNTTTYDATSKLVGADALVEMRYSTSNDFGHPTADIYMWIEIEY